jgi:hypothetical protein
MTAGREYLLNTVYITSAAKRIFVFKQKSGHQMEPIAIGCIIVGLAFLLGCFYCFVKSKLN